MRFIKFCRLNALLLASGIGLLAGCTSTAKQAASDTPTVAAPASSEASSSDVDQDLPRLDLDSTLLEQLLLANFASYSGDWPRAAENALAAAQTSQDFRLARLGALLALRAKNFDQATSGASLWVKLQPDSEDAAKTLLLAQLGAGAIDSAFAGFQQIQGLAPIDQHIKDVTGLLVGQANGESAIGIAQRYIDQYPDSAQVALSSAYVAETFEREDLLEQWLGQALQLRPDWDSAAQLRVRLLRQQDKDDERIEYITQFVKQHPSSIGMRINYAAELAKQEKYQEALTVMQAVVQDDGQNVAALSYGAALAQQLDQTVLAKDLYQRAIRVDPKNEDVHWALARLAVLDEDYERAERHYLQINSPQNFFRAQLQVANMRYYTRGLEDAINTLRAMEPHTEAEYVDRATTRHYLLLQDRQYEEAYGAINETLVYLPDNNELIYARALVAAELNELNVAEHDLRAILAKNPDHANALNALGYTLADQTDRYAEAKELIIKALELRPNDAHILDSMGWVLYRLNELVESLAYLQRAYAQAPESEVAAHLGEVLWESGDTDAAKKIWRAAVVKEADNPLLLKTMRRYGVSVESP